MVAWAERVDRLGRWFTRLIKPLPWWAKNPITWISHGVVCYVVSLPGWFAGRPFGLEREFQAMVAWAWVCFFYWPREHEQPKDRWRTDNYGDVVIAVLVVVWLVVRVP